MKFIIFILYSFTFLTLIHTFVYGYFFSQNPTYFPIHLISGLLSTFLVILTTMISMFYFLGVRDRLKEEERLYKIPAEVLQKAKKIKKDLFNYTGTVMTLALLNAILAGTTILDLIPSFFHHSLGYLIIFLYCLAFKAELQFQKFKPELFKDYP